MFPKDDERCRKWVQDYRREDLLNMPTKKLYNYQACSNHSKEFQIKNKEMRNKLNKNAIPTLLDVSNPLAKVTPLR